MTANKNSFEALKDLHNRAERLRRKAEEESGRARTLKKYRDENRPLPQILDDMNRHSWNQEIKDRLHEVLAAMRHDILRVAEMHFEARARELSTQAKAAESALEASILLVPEATEESAR